MFSLPVVKGRWGGVPMRDPQRRGFGIKGESEYPVNDKVLSLANDTFDQHGPGCKERVYQLQGYLAHKKTPTPLGSP